MINKRGDEYMDLYFKAVPRFGDLNLDYVFFVL